MFDKVSFEIHELTRSQIFVFEVTVGSWKMTVTVATVAVVVSVVFVFLPSPNYYHPSVGTVGP